MVPPSILSPLIWLSDKIKFALLISNFLDEFISTFNSPSIILFADMLLILLDVIWFSANIRLAFDTSKYLFLFIDDVKSMSESSIEPFFHNPLFTNKVPIPIESIVPPFILLPLIESSAKFKNAFVKSKTPPWLKVILFEFKFSILKFSIVPPSILSPLIWLSEINIFASLTSNIFPSETLKLVKIKLLISTLSIVPPLILFALICLSLNNTVDSDKSIILSLVVLILAFSIEILLIVPPLIFSPEIELSGKITLPKVVSIILPTPKYMSDSWITPLFHTPVITSNCVILISLIVPPSILLPEICLSFKIRLASLRSTILSKPISIPTLVILPPSILSPLIWLSDNIKSPSLISKKYLPPDKFSPIVISELLINPLFHIPELTSKSFIVILLITPSVILLGFIDSILSPLIWLSAKINSPSDTSNIPNETSIFLFIPTSILASVIVPPSILSPLIWLSANNILPFVISNVLLEFIVISDSKILLSTISLVSILIPEKVPPKIASALIELLGNKISPWISNVLPELIVISVLIILPLFIIAWSTFKLSDTISPLTFNLFVEILTVSIPEFLITKSFLESNSIPPFIVSNFIASDSVPSDLIINLDLLVPFWSKIISWLSSIELLINDNVVLLTSSYKTPPAFRPLTPVIGNDSNKIPPLLLFRLIASPIFLPDSNLIPPFNEFKCIDSGNIPLSFWRIICCKCPNWPGMSLEACNLIAFLLLASECI